jgi:LEA14-like dessication related protein
LSLTLNIKNANGFGVDLRGLNYALKLQGRSLAKGAAQTSAQVAQKAKGRNPVEPGP